MMNAFISDTAEQFGIGKRSKRAEAKRQRKLRNQKRQKLGMDLLSTHHSHTPLVRNQRTVQRSFGRRAAAGLTADQRRAAVAGQPQGGARLAVEAAV